LGITSGDLCFGGCVGHGWTGLGAWFHAAMGGWWQVPKPGVHGLCPSVRYGQARQAGWYEGGKCASSTRRKSGVSVRAGSHMRAARYARMDSQRAELCGSGGGGGGGRGTRARTHAHTLSLTQLRTCARTFAYNSTVVVFPLSLTALAQHLSTLHSLHHCIQVSLPTISMTTGAARMLWPPPSSLSAYGMPTHPQPTSPPC
jgi:hypothetical protein